MPAISSKAKRSCTSGRSILSRKINARQSSSGNCLSTKKVSGQSCSARPNASAPDDARRHDQRNPLSSAQMRRAAAASCSTTIAEPRAPVLKGIWQLQSRQLQSRELHGGGIHGSRSKTILTRGSRSTRLSAANSTSPTPFRESNRAVPSPFQLAGAFSIRVGRRYDRTSFLVRSMRRRKSSIIPPAFPQILPCAVVYP